MATIRLFPGPPRILYPAPADLIVSYITDRLEASQELVWLGNTEQVFESGSLPTDARCGTRVWIAAFRDTRPVQEQLNNLANDLKAVNQQLQTIAAEALKRAVSFQDDVWPSQRFKKLAGIDDSRLNTFVISMNQELQTEMSAGFFAEKADGIINRSDNQACHISEEQLDVDIGEAKALLQDLPELRRQCVWEARIIDLYDRLKQCFPIT